MGESDFVAEVLSQAEEQFEKRYRMQAEGYDLEKLIRRVAEIMDLDPKRIMEPGKDRRKTQARSMLCYWATEYLGLSQTQLAQLLNLTQPAISQAVQRGGALAKSQSYSL